MAEWLGRGLQSLVQQFESARRLTEKPRETGLFAFSSDNVEAILTGASYAEIPDPYQEIPKSESPEDLPLVATPVRREVRDFFAELVALARRAQAHGQDLFVISSDF